MFLTATYDEINFAQEQAHESFATQKDSSNHCIT